MDNKNEIILHLEDVIKQLKGTVSLNTIKNYITILLFYKYISNNLEDDNLKFEYVITQKENLANILENTFEQIEKKINHPSFNKILTSFDFNNVELGTDEQSKNEKLYKIMKATNDIQYNNDIDTLGFINEYIMKITSSNSGKINGEYYTPSCISELIHQIATYEKNDYKTVYDPTCGSGALLLSFANRSKNKRYKLFGQEINFQSHNFCKMNMIMNNIELNNFDIQCGDTLMEPKHLDKKFDVIISNPPFSVSWEPEKLSQNDERFKHLTKLPPKSKGDLAFVLHSLYHLETDGVLCVVEFPGVLYRTGAEQKIREYLITNNYLHCVIQLPPNIFENTSISTCLLIFKKNRNLNDTITYIDCDKYFVKGTNTNTISKEQIEEIINLYKQKPTNNENVKEVSRQNIICNDYNLSVSCYISHFQKETIDINQIEEDIRIRKKHLETLSNEIDEIIKRIRG